MSKDANESLRNAFQKALNNFISNPKNDDYFNALFGKCIDLYETAVSSIQKEKKDSISTEDVLPWIDDLIKPILDQTKFPPGFSEIMELITGELSNKARCPRYKNTGSEDTSAFHALALILNATAITKRQLLKSAYEQLKAIQQEPPSLNMIFNKNTIPISKDFIFSINQLIQPNLEENEYKFEDLYYSTCDKIFEELYPIIQAEILSKDSSLDKLTLLTQDIQFPQELSALSEICKVQQEIERERHRQILLKNISGIKTTLEKLNDQLSNAKSSPLEKLSFFKLSTDTLKELVFDLIKTIPEDCDHNSSISLEDCNTILLALHGILDEKLYPLKNWCQGNPVLQKIYLGLEKILNKIKPLLSNRQLQTQLEITHQSMHRP